MVRMSSFRRLRDEGGWRRNEDQRFRLSNEFVVQSPQRRDVCSATGGGSDYSRPWFGLSRYTDGRRSPRARRVWYQWKQNPMTTGWWTMGELATGANPMSCPCLSGAWIQHQERLKACLSRANKHLQDQRVLGAADRPRCQEATWNLVPLQELDSKSSLSLSAFIRPFCSCSSRAALLETPRELCFRISSKNLPVLRHRHPRLNISSGSLPLAAALVRHLDPRSNEIALRLFLPRKPA
jgi:hypothetical protein